MLPIRWLSCDENDVGPCAVTSGAGGFCALDRTLVAINAETTEGLAAMAAIGGSMLAGGGSGVTPPSADCARLGPSTSARTAPSNHADLPELERFALRSC